MLIVVALASVVWWLCASPELDPSLVALLPFRVSGADPALANLPKGMVDLLATRLTERLQAVAPRVTG
jgi:hypothetical protein